MIMATHIYICSYNDNDDPFTVVAEPDTVVDQVEAAVFDLHGAFVERNTMDGSTHIFYCFGDEAGSFKVYAVPQRNIYNVEDAAKVTNFGR